MTVKLRISRLLAKILDSRSFEIIAGTMAGVLIIILAVAISTLAFGSYGWGLFVLTPLTVGVATGYLVNRRELLSVQQTNGFVLVSAALGCFGLILFALEGLICLILAAPLGAGVAIVGGLAGRKLASSGKGPSGPIYSTALIPAVFALEAIYPPSAVLQSHNSITIDAPASAVWEALISEKPIKEPPTIAGQLGLAFPISAQISGEYVGGTRIGHFSTGIAWENITYLEENRLLGLNVVTQPPAMQETSPFGSIHTPHLVGYFETGETRFELTPLGSGKSTQLTIKASHRLNIDPLFYWQPIAEWAIKSNTERVLREMKTRAES